MLQLGKPSVISIHDEVLKKVYKERKCTKMKTNLYLCFSFQAYRLPEFSAKKIFSIENRLARRFYTI